jgi:rod shape-determining protein MreD
MTFTAFAVLLQPGVDQTFSGAAVRPNLQLAPLAICLSLCPGAPAVICCGFLGLVLDCLAGPQLGARAACFCLLAALGSIAGRRNANSWPARFVVWAAMLFVAEILSRAIDLSTHGTFPPATIAFDAALSALATTTFLSCLWLLYECVARGPRWRGSNRRFAPAIGRAGGGD